MIYFDSGILVKTYVREIDSENAVKVLSRSDVPIIFTHLHELEITNALCLKCFRKEISKKQLNASLNLMEQDLLDGYLYKPAYEFSEVFNTARLLALKHSMKLGTRSLDILHLAIAKHLECSVFLTWDERQTRLAKAIGFETR